MLALKMQELKDSIDLQLLLNEPHISLEENINQPKYQEFSILKKRYGLRKIQAPEQDLRTLQSSLNFYLQGLYRTYKPKAAHGFIRNFSTYNMVYNIVSNAAVHSGSRFVMNMDLSNFFQNISAKQVKTTLVNKPFALNEDIATLITLLCTYQKKLPVGSPSSPVLANMVCYYMDLALEKYCSERWIKYTRYADDLSFSCESYFTKEDIEDIKTIIRDFGFFIHPKKFRLQSSKSRQTVTGLVVNEKVNLPRKTIRKLRAILHSCRTEGCLEAANRHYNKGVINEYDLKVFFAKLQGQIAFVAQVRGKEDALFLRFDQELKQIIKAEGLEGKMWFSNG